MKKSIIIAMTPSGVIGKGNGLPWPRLPGDLPRFRRLTMGKPCIMGRKTFESLPKVLDDRMNIVVSRSGFTAPGVNVASSILEAWIRADESGSDEAFVIGGREIFKQAIHSCDRLYLTILDREFEGDTKIEFSDFKNWAITSREYVDGPIPYQNLILDRIPPMPSCFLTLERLDHNFLPAPRYGTALSAGVDFAACLTRPCMEVAPVSGDKKKFWVSPNNDSQTWVRHDHQPGEIPPEKHADLALLLYPGETVLVPLGWKCSFDINCVLKLHPRSSVGLKGIVLANGTGIIDPDYRGELFAALVNRTDKRITVKHGERIVQGVLTRFVQGIVVEGEVDKTARGEGGFGSTGQIANDLPSTPGIAAIKQAVVEDPPLE
jgi:dihydrofolate reductase